MFDAFEAEPIRYKGKKQFFLIYGAMRTATRWLAQMLNTNVDAPTVEFVHEGWTPNRFEAMNRQWRRSKPGIYGSVGQAGYETWRFIHRAFRPKLVFLWRDPMKHARSILCHEPKATRRMAFEQRLFLTFAVYEAVLTAAEDDELEYEHWALEHFTTPAGFEVFCDELGLPIRRPLLMVDKFNSTSPQAKRPLGEYHDLVVDTLTMFPRVIEAQREALERVIVG